MYVEKPKVYSAAEINRASKWAFAASKCQRMVFNKHSRGLSNMNHDSYFSPLAVDRNISCSMFLINKSHDAIV